MYEYVSLPQTRNSCPWIAWKVPKCEIFNLMDSRYFFTIKPPWVGVFGTVIRNLKLFRFRHDFEVYSRNFELVHVEPALKKIYFGQPCAKVDLNPMPESTLDLASDFRVLLSPPFAWPVTASRSKPTSYLCSLLLSTHLIHSGSQKNDIFCTSINCTYNTVCPLWCKLCNYKYTQSDLPSAEAGKYRGRILGQNPAKSLTSFPPCYSQSTLQLCLRFLFLQITQPLTTSVKEKGGKPDRKPFPPFPMVGLRNPYRYLMSENSQDYAQKPQHDCTFMNSASVYATENSEVQERSSLHLNCFQWIIYLLCGFCCTQRKLATQLYMLDGNSPNPTLPSSPACISWCTNRAYNYNLSSSSWSLPPVRVLFDINEGCI